MYATFHDAKTLNNSKENVYVGSYQKEDDQTDQKAYNNPGFPKTS